MIKKNEDDKCTIHFSKYPPFMVITECFSFCVELGEVFVAACHCWGKWGNKGGDLVLVAEKNNQRERREKQSFFVQFFFCTFFFLQIFFYSCFFLQNSTTKEAVSAPLSSLSLIDMENCQSISCTVVFYSKQNLKKNMIIQLPLGPKTFKAIILSSSHEFIQHNNNRFTTLNSRLDQLPYTQINTKQFFHRTKNRTKLFFCLVLHFGPFLASFGPHNTRAPPNISILRRTTPCS